MITVPVSGSAYQTVVASMQQGGGITFHTADGGPGSTSGSGPGNTIQLIGTPLQLANGQIIAKVETTAEESSRQSSIQNLVTKVMGQQSIHNEVKPATLTITPVGSASSASTNTSGPIIQMVGSTTHHHQPTTRLRTRAEVALQQQQIQQPDTTESLD